MQLGIIEEMRRQNLCSYLTKHKTKIEKSKLRNSNLTKDTKTTPSFGGGLPSF